MNNHDKPMATATLPRPSRRYERLIGYLLNNNLLDVTRCQRRAIYNHVASLYARGYGRCHAMVLTAEEFRCSYEKVRTIIYDIDKQQTQPNTMNHTIKIRNESDCTTIDIEGTIGISEQWQFDNPEERVATYERFRERVSQIADIRNTHIVVNIRSTGGDVNDALLIYEALRSTGAHITTRCFGYTASAATIVAQAATEGCRQIAPSSLYLIHKSICSTEGNAEELQNEVEMLNLTDNRLAEVYAKHSGQSIDTIIALMSENGGRGRWLSPAETIAQGLADMLVPDMATSQPTSERGDTLTVRAERSLKRLLHAIGLGDKEPAQPNPADDINFIPREAPKTPSNVTTAAHIDFEERQRNIEPTTTKECDDPAIGDMHMTPRLKAYEDDARAMRSMR